MDWHLKGDCFEVNMWRKLRKNNVRYLGPEPVSDFEHRERICEFGGADAEGASGQQFVTVKEG